MEIFRQIIGLVQSDKSGTDSDVLSIGRLSLIGLIGIFGYMVATGQIVLTVEQWITVLGIGFGYVGVSKGVSAYRSKLGTIVIDAPAENNIEPKDSSHSAGELS